MLLIYIIFGWIVSAAQAGFHTHQISKAYCFNAPPEPNMTHTSGVAAQAVTTPPRDKNDFVFHFPDDQSSVNHVYAGVNFNNGFALEIGWESVDSLITGVAPAAGTRVWTPIARTSLKDKVSDLKPKLCWLAANDMTCIEPTAAANGYFRTSGPGVKNGQPLGYDFVFPDQADYLANGHKEMQIKTHYDTQSGVLTVVRKASDGTGPAIILSLTFSPPIATEPEIRLTAAEALRQEDERSSEELHKTCSEIGQFFQTAAAAQPITAKRHSRDYAARF